MTQQINAASDHVYKRNCEVIVKAEAFPIHFNWVASEKARKLIQEKEWKKEGKKFQIGNGVKVE